MSGTDKATGRVWSVDHGIGSNDPIILLCGDKAMGELRSASAGIAVASLLAERDANGLLAIRNAQAATKAENERDALAARVAAQNEELHALRIAVMDLCSHAERAGGRNRSMLVRTLDLDAARAALGGKGGAA